MLLFNIFTFLAFLAGVILILHPILSNEEYPENGDVICIIMGIASVCLGFYMLNHPY